MARVLRKSFVKSNVKLRNNKNEKKKLFFLSFSFELTPDSTFITSMYIIWLYPFCVTGRIIRSWLNLFLLALCILVILKLLFQVYSQNKMLFNLSKHLGGVESFVFFYCIPVSEIKELRYQFRLRKHNI